MTDPSGRGVVRNSVAPAILPGAGRRTSTRCVRITSSSSSCASGRREGSGTATRSFRARRARKFPQAAH
eukprot:13451164-Heterocapsa_arctica.AAC.1